MRKEKREKKKEKRGFNRFLFTIFLSLFIIFAFSCKTTPKTSDALLERSNFVPLDSGAVVYVIIDVKNSRPIINNISIKGLDDKQFQQILDLTQSAAAAFYSQGSQRRFQVTAWGSYPSSRANMALGSNKQWKKMTSPASKSDYWYSQGRQLSVALNPQQAFACAAGTEQSADPFYVAPGTAIPEGFNEFRKGAVFSCWLENPAPAINKKLAETGLPIELPADELFICLFPKDELYEGQIRIQVSSEAQARGLAAILVFARGLISASSANANSKAAGLAALMPVLFANPPVQDGNTLTITTPPLSGREIALLFNSFSVQ